LSSNFEHCGHLVKVVAKARAYPTSIRLSKTNFFYVHDKYVNPYEYVQKKNVCFLFVDEYHAVFTVTQESM